MWERISAQRSSLAVGLRRPPPARRPRPPHKSCGGVLRGTQTQADVQAAAEAESTADTTAATVPAASPATQQQSQPQQEPPQAHQLSLRATLAASISEVDREQWNVCAAGAEGEELNPFVTWEFLHALEASESVCAAQHLLLRDDATGQVVGCAPLYLKGHSFGEYVFDQSWADAYHRLGLGSYYPKLQCCVPFTPVPGPRLLVRPGPQAAAVRRALADTLRQVADELGVSSLHVTFSTQAEWQQLGERHGYLQRTGLQFHWFNRRTDGSKFSSFDGGADDTGSFLGSLRQSRRKSIRQDRKKAAASGLRMGALQGTDIKPRHWEDFYLCYRNTTDRKWGTPYLTKAFFPMLGELMADRAVVMIAETPDGALGQGKLIAGALNLLGSHALFGRNWGCRYGERFPGLHMELSYYQALEFAIAQGLERVEAGAQGEHKIARGYLPHFTYSAHYLPEGGRGGKAAALPGAGGASFAGLVDRYLCQERADIQYTLEVLHQEASPYKDGRQ